mmetsp:Transcript_68718/g.129681  ORF Transcript_68718/g.129681 Transcript_68718/m.129681 type:complete len:218 (+) Transcript_68718:28-681(+)
MHIASRPRRSAPSGLRGLLQLKRAPSINKLRVLFKLGRLLLLREHVLNLRKDVGAHGHAVLINQFSQLLPPLLSICEEIQALHRWVSGSILIRQQHEVVEDARALLNGIPRGLVDVLLRTYRWHPDLISAGWLLRPQEVSHDLRCLESHLEVLLRLQERGNCCQRRCAKDLFQQPNRLQDMPCERKAERWQLGSASAELHARFMQVSCLLVTVTKFC